MKNKQKPETDNSDQFDKPDQDLETRVNDKDGEIISSLDDEVEEPEVVDYSAIHWEERSQALADAQQLIRYASHKGKEVPDEVLECIFSSIGKVETRHWSVNDEVAFWKSFRKLSEMVLPVTISSIRASVARPGFRSKAARETLYFSIFTFFVLIVLIIGQVYWVIGNNIADEIRKDKMQLQELGIEHKVIDSQVYPLESIIGPLPDEQRRLLSQMKQKDIETIAKAELIRRHLRANLHFLKGWVDKVRFDREDDLNQRKDVSATSTVEQPDEVGYMLAWAHSIIAAMSTYFLPILYGLVGSCAYILRSISKDIANVTFSRTSIIQYRLRLPLGMLSGIAVGWFFKSTSENAGFGSIQPLAMSFLAGYSVELLFTAMDKLIGTFAGNDKKE